MLDLLIGGLIPMAKSIMTVQQWITNLNAMPIHSFITQIVWATGLTDREDVESKNDYLIFSYCM